MPRGSTPCNQQRRPRQNGSHITALKANDAALITLTRPPEWHSWEFGPAMAWLADRLSSAASDRILAQLERSWDCPEPELWATLLWDRQARQLIAKPAYDLDYLGIFTDWHTRHSPESVVWDCRRAYALLCGAAARGM
jgi:hypothetical protein